MKTVIQALIDEVIYPIPYGKVENIAIKRGIVEEDEYTKENSETISYKGALADCLISLLQAVNFSESDKSVGTLTDAQRKAILKKANALYGEIGEPEVDDGTTPTVYIIS
jgi:hypothetical protein